MKIEYDPNYEPKFPSPGLKSLPPEELDDQTKRFIREKIIKSKLSDPVEPLQSTAYKHPWMDFN